MSAAHPLIDARVGLVTRIVAQPSRPRLPRSLVSCVAHVADTTRFDSWRADPYAHGAALFDQAAAAGPALGEAVERYCGNAVPSGLRQASAQELAAAGEQAVELRRLALYADHQYAAPGFPFVPLTDSLRVHWIPGLNLHTGRRSWVPAALAYLNVRHGLDEPALTSPQYAGIAAGPTRAHAEASALEEVIERDAVAVWWHGEGTAVGLDVSVDPLLRSVLTDPQGADLLYSFIALPHCTAVPVVGVLVEDPTAGLVTFGSACRARPEQAAAKALTEALAQLPLSVDLADENSPLWRRLRDGDVRAAGLSSFRADRAYLDDLGPTWRRMTDLPANAQLYLDPRMHGAPLDRLRLTPTEPLADCAWTAAPVAGATQRRAVYLARLRGCGFEAISVDLTTADVAAVGLRVVRVCVPGLVGNAPAAFPLLGSPRLRTEPRAWGLRPDVPDPDDLVTCPLPFC